MSFSLSYNYAQTFLQIITINGKAQPQLKIHGAAYGLGDVTDIVRRLVRNNAVCVKANDTYFSDTWRGHTKTLVVVYQYGNELPQTAIANQKNEIMKISYVPTATYQPSCDSLTILGAAYGRGEVTSKVQSLVVNNNLNIIKANDDVFFDTFPGHTKTTVIVYQYGSNPVMAPKITEQDGSVAIYPPWS